MATNIKTIIISSLQTILMSIGVLSIGILISMYIPSILNSANYTIPSLFTILRSWLKPPYLYFIINAIIITIAASTRLHHHRDTVAATPLRADKSSPYGGVTVEEPVDAGGYYYDDVVSVKDVEVEIVGRFDDDKDVLIKESIRDDKNSTVVEWSTWTPPPLKSQQALDKVSPEFFSERPPVSSRVGLHRRPVKAAQAEGGKALRVSKPKKHDTLETTWKAITEGRHIPLTRHLKKTDTWEHHDRQIDLLDDSSHFPGDFKKCEAFHDRTNSVTPPVMTTMLKKEPSLSQDELNRRVEAFINKFNEDMRLQRQQSMQQFMDMINRAT